jgi:Glyoxalase-like domain
LSISITAQIEEHSQGDLHPAGCRALHAPQPRLCPADRYPEAEAEAAAAAAFWSAALAATARPVPHEPRFTLLHQALPGLVTAVQAVDDAPRCPLGIETGNVAAQTARLLAFGAVPAAQWLECRVLRAPGGHLLCVIPVHRDPGAFKAHATTWP